MSEVKQWNLFGFPISKKLTVNLLISGALLYFIFGGGNAAQNLEMLPEKLEAFSDLTDKILKGLAAVMLAINNGVYVKNQAKVDVAKTTADGAIAATKEAAKAEVSVEVNRLQAELDALKCGDAS